jgi:hydrogenase nickel incorporation protein HypA/HybF
MHELSLAESLFDLADRAVGAHPVSAVRRVVVRIGELAGVERELFETAFEARRAGRGYGAAKLAIVEEVASWSCVACGAVSAAEGPLRCGACDGDLRLAAGGELVLERLELEVADV